MNKTIKLSVGNEKVPLVSDPAPADTTKAKDVIVPPVPPVPVPPVPDVPTLPAPTVPIPSNNNDPFVEGVEIELDGIALTIDKDGNAVDSTGKVVKNKTDLVALLANDSEGDEPVIPTIEAIQSMNNLVITDEIGKPVKYENTLEGFAAYTSDAVALGKQLGVKEYEDDLFGSFPILRDVLEHLQLNGTLENFNNEVDYSSIQLDKTNQNQLISVITAARQAKGDSADEIQDYIDAIKTKGTLAEIAEKSLTYLNTTKSKRDQERRQDIAAMQAAEKAKEKAYWDDVNNVLSSRKLKVGSDVITIPEVIRITEDGKTVVRTPKDFDDYISKEKVFTIDGKRTILTQHQYDLMIENSKRTVNDDIFEAYRRFTKYDDAQLIRAKSNSQTARTVLKLTSNKAATGKGVTKSDGKKLVIPVK